MGAVGGGVLGEGAVAGGAGDFGEVVAAEGFDYGFGGLGDEDFALGVEEGFQAFPIVGEERSLAGGGFKEAAAGAIAHLGHGGSGDV